MLEWKVYCNYQFTYYYFIIEFIDKCKWYRQAQKSTHQFKYVGIEKENKMYQEMFIIVS